MASKAREMMSSKKDAMKARVTDKDKSITGIGIRSKTSGLLHRGKSDNSSEHVARPLSQLRDPNSFAPPPKRTGSGLIPAPPPTKAAPRQVVMSPSKYQDPRAAAIAPPQGQKQLEDEYHQQYQHHPQQEEEEEAPPPQPYRVNTTGLATNHLPPPPGRRDGADGRAPPPLPPPSYQSAVAGSKPGPPSLPPRLPPRTNSASSTTSPAAISPASTGGGLLNQGAINRLGAAGVSVPGFGIGRSSPANQSSPSPPPPPRPSAAPQSASHMNELQNRFSKLSTSSNSAPPPPSEGTTWAQKQAALKTASAFHKDPSSVSFSDAKAAASTANNFRQRHGDQIAAGVNAANNANQKYGVMDKVGSYTGAHSPQNQVQPSPTASPVPGLAGKKKPPPPPPPKKRGLGNAPPVPGSSPGDDVPPPIPMATRPQF